MKNLFEAGKLLLLDMASTFFFLVLFLLSHNITLSVTLGMALGITQIGWQFVRKLPIDTMQWMSLFLVLGSGAATLLTHDPRFVMVKPSVIYLIVGVVMLKRGWMNRYLPPIAIEMVPDIAVDLRLRLGGPDVLFRGLEPHRGSQFQRGDMVGLDVDLRDRQQGRPVPDPIRHHAHHRRAPSPRPDDSCGLLTNFREPLRLRTRSARGQARPLRPPVNRASCDVERRPNSANATLTSTHHSDNA